MLLGNVFFCLLLLLNIIGKSEIYLWYIASQYIIASGDDFVRSSSLTLLYTCYDFVNGKLSPLMVQLTLRAGKWVVQIFRHQLINLSRKFLSSSSSFSFSSLVQIGDVRLVTHNSAKAKKVLPRPQISDFLDWLFFLLVVVSSPSTLLSPILALLITLTTTYNYTVTSWHKQGSLYFISGKGFDNTQIICFLKE